MFTSASESRFCVDKEKLKAANPMKICRFLASVLSLVVIVPDEQGYSCKSQDEFEGYDKDVLHNGNGFIS